MTTFPTTYAEILNRLDTIDPVSYGRSRNFVDGAVSYLSPYVSRGVFSTKQVSEYMLARGYPASRIQKFIQELCWRDYWQQVWIHKGNQIDEDLQHPQPRAERDGIPVAIVTATTGIEAIDEQIRSFYQTGYLHNHVRMYTAALACNIGRAHWYQPARWMYYHLLDADWASNALSWQWVAGSNSRKTYLANQENISKYCHSNQQESYLNKPYSELEHMPIPLELQETVLPDLNTSLPDSHPLAIDPNLPTLLYNFYNMDPKWRGDVSANRVLILEPSVFERYPISNNSLQFLMDLGNNIPDLQTFVGEFSELHAQLGSSAVYFKEHPLNKYIGHEDPRDWMYPVNRYYPSFFSYWKACQKSVS